MIQCQWHSTVGRAFLTQVEMLLIQPVGTSEQLSIRRTLVAEVCGTRTDPLADSHPLAIRGRWLAEKLWKRTCCGSKKN